MSINDKANPVKWRDQRLATLAFQGKVRNVYEPTGVFFEVSDRLSVFDRVIYENVPLKGNVLNCISQENKKKLEEKGFITDYLPISEEICRLFKFDEVGKVSYAKYLTMIPFEIIVRGYLTGSAYKAYEKGEPYCGFTFPEGLHDGSKLSEPIVTPTTKESTGHDRPVTRQEAVELLANWMREKEITPSSEDIADIFDSEEELNNSAEFSEEARKFLHGSNVEGGYFDGMPLYVHEENLNSWEKAEVMFAYDNAATVLDTIYEISLLAFAELTSAYEEHGILFIDSKFEFGFDSNGEITLADEVGTPDSSRMAPKDVYEETGKIVSLDKQIVRDYCKENGFSGNEDDEVPFIPYEIWEKVSNTYVDVAEELFGKEIVDKYL